MAAARTETPARTPAASLPVGARAARLGRGLLPCCVVLVSLFGPIGFVGLWDPFELRVAELGRRIAIHGLGAAEFALDGADNSMMTLGALGSGELPFTSVALGFRLFGLHAWAGRLPLALWALMGVLAVAWLAWRLDDLRTGVYAAMVLATTPLYFVQAHTMLGDAVALALGALAVAGLAVGLFGESDGAVTTPVGRAAALVLGALGLAGGYATRGVLIGVAIPALGVGLAWLASEGPSGPRTDRFRRGLGVALLVLGAGSVAAGALVLGIAFGHPERFHLPLGAQVATPNTLATFDGTLAQLAHGSFPFAGLAFVAVGETLVRTAVDPAVPRRGASLRLTALSVVGVGVAVHAGLAPWVAPVPLTMVAAVSVLVAAAVRDAERNGGLPVALAMGVAAFSVLVIEDLVAWPAKGFAAYGVVVEVPVGIETPRWLRAVGFAALGVWTLALIERDGVIRPRFSLAAYGDKLSGLRSAFDGRLLALLIVAEAALVGLGALSLASGLGARLPALDALGLHLRHLASFGWIGLPVVAVGLPASAMLLRDAARWLHDITGVPRARFGFGALLAAALAGSLGYYPSLVATVSPQNVFAVYRARAQPGEELAALGIDSSTSVYSLGRRIASLDTGPAAFRWLSGGEPRRFLALRTASLSELNALWREAGRGNLPVVAGSSPGMLLATTNIDSGEANGNPLCARVLDRAPTPRHAVSANLGGMLEALGWEVAGVDGVVVDAVYTGRAYEFRIYWRVQGRMTGSWETFIHIDGQGRRFNGDHATLGGDYPFRFWRPGDVIVDSHVFTLEPNFTPGEYDVYYGLFAGSRRLQVTRGRNDDDRLVAGKLRVR